MTPPVNETQPMVTAEVDGRVGIVSLNRPDRMNAVTAELFADLTDALATVQAADVKAVIVTGNGRGFCAGADLKAERPALEPGSRRLRQLYNPAIAQISRMSAPVIAAVNGPAVGAGVSLAAAADIRIVASDAYFVPGFVDVGLVPDNGGSWHLPRIIGTSRAALWLCSGNRLTALEAQAWGLADEVVETADVLERAKQLAAVFASKPGCAVTATIDLIRRSRTSSLTEQLEMEAAASDATTTHPERIAARAAKSASITSA